MVSAFGRLGRSLFELLLLRFGFVRLGLGPCLGGIGFRFALVLLGSTLGLKLFVVGDVTNGFLRLALGLLKNAHVSWSFLQYGMGVVVARATATWRAAP